MGEVIADASDARIVDNGRVVLTIEG